MLLKMIKFFVLKMRFQVKDLHVIILTLEWHGINECFVDCGLLLGKI